MSFPKSTDIVTLTRPKRGNPRPRRQHLTHLDLVNSEDESYNETQLGDGQGNGAMEGESGIGGVSLDFGMEGAVVLQRADGVANGPDGSDRNSRRGGLKGRRREKKHALWEWKWISEEDESMSSAFSVACLALPWDFIAALYTSKDLLSLRKDRSEIGSWRKQDHISSD